MDKEDIAKKVCKVIYFAFSVVLLGEWLIDWTEQGCEAVQLRSLYMIFSLTSAVIWWAIEKMMDNK